MRRRRGSDERGPHLLPRLRYFRSEVSGSLPHYWGPMLSQLPARDRLFVADVAGICDRGREGARASFSPVRRAEYDGPVSRFERGVGAFVFVLPALLRRTTSASDHASAGLPQRIYREGPRHARADPPSHSRAQWSHPWESTTRRRSVRPGAQSTRRCGAGSDRTRTRSRVPTAVTVTSSLVIAGTSTITRATTTTRGCGRRSRASAPTAITSARPRARTPSSCRKRRRG
jgi:hypothetical protein